MMSLRSPLPYFLAAALLWSCNSATEPRNHTLPLAGRLLLAGGPPDPSMYVLVQAYPDSLDPPAPTSASLYPDSTGAYSGLLGPFPGGNVDSLRIYGAQPGCTDGRSTSQALGTIVASGRTYTLPTFDLTPIRPFSTLVAGLVACGIINRGTLLDESMGLALVIDSIHPNALYETVFGRWDISHRATVGDAYGHFTGYFLLGYLDMDLTPRPEDPLCAGMHLTIPIAADRTFQQATLSGTTDPRCYIVPGGILLYAQDWEYTLP